MREQMAVHIEFSNFTQESKWMSSPLIRKMKANKNAQETSLELLYMQANENAY